MKVRLLARKGANQAGAVVDYDTSSARWLIEQGHAELVPELPPELPEKAPETAADAPPAAPKRGRPRKVAP